MFRVTDSIKVVTDDGNEVVIKEHTFFQGDTPGMRQYRASNGDAAKRISADEFEIAGFAGVVRARRIVAA